MTKENLVALRVGVDESLDAWGPEIKYVFRTLLRLAGFAHEFVWMQQVDTNERVDIYYGRKAETDAPIHITACGKSFADAPEMEVRKVAESEGVSFLEFFDSNGQKAFTPNKTRLTFANDIVFASYWLLTGARETHYARDSLDNFKLDGSSFLKNSLAAKPLVSMYGSLIRRFFKELGYEPLDHPWISREAEAAFVVSHDVDYPQIIRSIECLRLLKSRGLKSLPSIKGVLNGTNNFWRFSDWVEFEKRFGIRSAFYFMARKGSLFQYATGTPDGLYDIRTPEFIELFRYLKDEGCEVGLHASYNAYHDVDQLRREKTLLEDLVGLHVEGNRHHYWRLNPAAPYETLHKHQQVGLSYDSSLAFEFYPGFRRGICHPFRVFHPTERCELDLVELPPAWMDDHFDRRLEQNRIVDPESYALGLVNMARATSGVVVVDYHARGMNADFYPRYGPWLQQFIEKHLDSSVVYSTPQEIVAQYTAYVNALEVMSSDRTDVTNATCISSRHAEPTLKIEPLREYQIPAVARLHFDTFGEGELHGHSIAKFGCEFLEEVFYRLNLDNPDFFCDVASYGDKVIGFSVYSTQRTQVFRRMLRHHFPGLVLAGVQILRRNPAKLVPVLTNIRYLGGEELPWLRSVPGWWLVTSVLPEYRTKDFEQKVGTRVAASMFDRMELTMQQHGCREWYGVVHPENPPINVFLQRRGARLMGVAQAQGMSMNYYLKTIADGPSLRVETSPTS